MHELAMILWLDKGDSWIYLPCCGVLIDFFLITNLNTNLWEITWYSLSVVLTKRNSLCSRSLPARNYFPFFILNVYSNWVAAKFFNLNLRLSCKTKITTERSSLEIKVCKETSDFFFCIVACLTWTSTDKFGKWTDR